MITEEYPESEAHLCPVCLTSLGGDKRITYCSACQPWVRRLIQKYGYETNTTEQRARLHRKVRAIRFKDEPPGAKPLFRRERQVSEDKYQSWSQTKLEESIKLMSEQVDDMRRELDRRHWDSQIPEPPVSEPEETTVLDDKPTLSVKQEWRASAYDLPPARTQSDGVTGGFKTDKQSPISTNEGGDTAMKNVLKKLREKFNQARESDDEESEPEPSSSGIRYRKDGRIDKRTIRGSYDEKKCLNKFKYHKWKPEFNSEHTYDRCLRCGAHRED